MSQDDIRLMLLEHEDVMRLAHSIVRSDGVFPHDLLIVGDIDGSLTVLEGNRRVAAMQMLLDPSLIPEPFTSRFPRATDELREQLGSIEAVVAPDRHAADHLIAQIHAFSARKGWSPLAKYRYAFTRYATGQTITDIAVDLGSEPSEVRKFIRRYNIYKQMLSLTWTSEERQILSGEELAVTPFLYPFERTAVKELVGDVFDSEGRRNPKYNVGIVDRFLKKLARDALIPQAITGKPRLTTRGTASESILEYFQKEHAELIAERERIEKAALPPPLPPSPPSPPSPPPPPPPPPPKPPQKPDEFFESFTVPSGLDQKIIALAFEIAKINYKQFPIAAGMLLRSLLEEVLREHLKRRGKFSDYKRSAGQKEGLKSMIIFASTTSNAVFKDKKTAEQLARFQHSAVKDDLDNIVHNRFGVMNKEGLIQIRPWIRPIIETIVKDEWA
jgi:hypothetical protein